jgi:pilus assembly protein CpaE
MDDQPRTIDYAGIESALPVVGSPPADQATAVAYLLDADSEEIVRRCFADLFFADSQVAHGSIDTAIEELPKRGWPHLLIVDLSGIGDPLPHINRLAEICNPGTEVIVVGERNDIVLYRYLKAAGVAEYFFKPLLASLFTRALGNINDGGASLQPSRSGKLVFVLGARGGVGATTIASNLAWYFAEARQRGVLLLDLDLYTGDAALQLDVQPSHALREALDDPTRIDQLFLERGVASVTGRLGLLAGLEPLADVAAPDEAAIQQLLQNVLAHFRYVVVDLPAMLARAHSNLMRLPSTLLLVSDGTIAGARDVARWRAFYGHNTSDRMLLHVLNKKEAPGALPAAEMQRVVPAPDVAIDWDREVMEAATLGTKAVQQCRAMHEGMVALSLLLSGATAEEDRPLWKRIFG